jgi:dephospho-CoA kinase
MIKIGLTGGIGSGKSVASDMFAELGINIIDTDIIARKVLINTPSLLTKLTATFGNEIIDKNGDLNRTTLRNIAFKSQENKALLDNIMHPVIRLATAREIKEVEKHSPHYCIIVVPLLYETGFVELVDRVLVVTAPHDRKLKWLEKRSHMTHNQAEKIINSQSSDKKKLSIANEHIHNDDDIQHIRQEVKKLHAFYSSLNY